MYEIYFEIDEYKDNTHRCIPISGECILKTNDSSEVCECYKKACEQAKKLSIGSLKRYCVYIVKIHPDKYLQKNNGCESYTINATNFHQGRILE